MAMLLIIDDDMETMEGLSRDLSASGYRVISAADAKGGLELARTGHPDLILVDVNLPGADGFQILRSLSTEELTKDIPVILMSGNSSTDYVLNAMKFGISDYIRKPYHRIRFLDKIQSVIRRSRMKKVAIESSLDRRITVHREQGITVISFLTHIGEREFVEEARRLFNRAFFNQIQKDLCVLDLRQTPEMADAEIRILKAIITLFHERELSVVAGRHYGQIIADPEYNESLPLFISWGDFMEFVNTKSVKSPT